MVVYISDYDVRGYGIEERRKLELVKSVIGGALYEVSKQV